MMTHGYDRAYNELYLNNAMVTLATMLDYAVNYKNKNIDFIFKRFIDSGYAMAFEKGDPAVIMGKSGIELYNSIVVNYSPICDYYSINRSPEYWLGYSLAYYQWFANTSFRNIHKQISLLEMLSWYNTLHEADISRFVDTLDNRLHIKETNLEYFRKRAGLSQSGLSQLSGVPTRSIQLYEQRQNDISKAQFNILYALSRALRCSVYDLAEQNDNMNTINYNSQYGIDMFMNRLTHIVAERTLNISQLQAQHAQRALQQQCYAYGYIGQFPYGNLQYMQKNNYLIPSSTFINNWDGYWTSLQQQQTLNIKEQQRLSKIGIEVIGDVAKAHNNFPISAVADAIGIITADNLADAILKAASLIDTLNKMQ